MAQITSITGVQEIPEVGHAAVNGASFYSKFKLLFRGFLGKLLKRMRFPLLLKETSFYDELTNKEITVRQNAYYTIISIGSRDYYFDLLSGEYDGTGYQIKSD